jgi:hypothetical protein
VRHEQPLTHGRHVCTHDGVIEAACPAAEASVTALKEAIHEIVVTHDGADVGVAPRVHGAAAGEWGGGSEQHTPRLHVPSLPQPSATVWYRSSGIVRPGAVSCFASWSSKQTKLLSASLLCGERMTLHTPPSAYSDAGDRATQDALQECSHEVSSQVINPERPDRVHRRAQNGSVRRCEAAFCFDAASARLHQI